MDEYLKAEVMPFPQDADILGVGFTKRCLTEHSPRQLQTIHLKMGFYAEVTPNNWGGINFVIYFERSLISEIVYVYSNFSVQSFYENLVCMLPTGK